ncbi:helix-turn-helix transcriptional regulator [Acidithiobacillus ferrooxidans]|uniref:AlpA family phage regulatory protein n=1 Tax=Acidithiobacillus ferrooxidans TaxID=920 RepID=A0A2W1KJM4_ACIFR|nr:AlpA family phage regulatory protein [Acidithiobacillus ferrooxidans]MCR1344171.1 AlpA family phage regulatory protein [Acidithiobacillus ferrooxidans]PZD82004.1 AlpA family phage regulatory protein [Acidithiobacillus ferrooxidans]QLK41705.1 AlpA family phage regulatory protein [Acidithiobacillus ferrooxidans]QZT53653.1 AlpA family phage regulatory protein [Acidithiobacillus ferrooxidans]BDB13822.1 DNA-binding protein [Acidithiobacillus ferrooxidans]
MEKGIRSTPREMDRILRPAEAARVLGVSRTTFWRIAKAADFPKKICIGARAVGWSRDDLLAWMEARKR